MRARAQTFGEWLVDTMPSGLRSRCRPEGDPVALADWWARRRAWCSQVGVHHLDVMRAERVLDGRTWRPDLDDDEEDE